MIHSQNYLSRAPIHLVIAALMAVTSQAQATLTPITAANGAELVYSSVSNATWTADTNLLGTLMQRNGFEAMARAIIAVTPSFVTPPNYYDYYDDLVPSPGVYGLRSNADFSSTTLGKTSWYGAMAFANYLNSVHYGGSTSWQLPGLSGGTCNFNATGSICGYNVNTNGNRPEDELAELYYTETGSKGAYTPTAVYDPSYGFKDAANLFSKKFVRQSAFDATREYWTNSEQQMGQNIRPGYFAENAGYFNMEYGYQYTHDKEYLKYAWLVSAGQVAAVPEPETYALLLAGLGLVGAVIRRRSIKTNH